MTIKHEVKLRFIAATLAVLTPLSVKAESKTMTWTIEGVKREAIVYLPAAKSPGGKAPLIFSFHGYGDDMQSFQTVDLHKAWPAAIVVYPQGLPTPRSNQPGMAGWQVQKGTYDDRDLKFADAALASLRRQYKVDDARIYATGFSNGAAFTYLLWAERPNVFAAFAPVAGTLRASTPPRTPRPVLHVGGVQDNRVKFETQKETIEMARKINGATGKAEGCGPGCLLYGSASGTPVMIWLHTGGHEYPDGTSERIVKFFKQHAMADRSL